MQGFIAGKCDKPARPRLLFGWLAGAREMVPEVYPVGNLLPQCLHRIGFAGIYRSNSGKSVLRIITSSSGLNPYYGV